MKIKTATLTGRALDYAVALIEKPGIASVSPDKLLRTNGKTYSPSTDWWIGGPIIERESIAIAPNEDMEAWSAVLQFRQGVDVVEGPTPLIAAMRCYVASKLGETVEIPDELV